MIHIVLLLSLFHNSQRSKFIANELNELKAAAAYVGQYQNHPPMMTASHADDMYITRAEADINVAMGALSKYKRHHCSEEDVRTVMSQLARDLEDIPPAIWPPMGNGAQI